MDGDTLQRSRRTIRSGRRRDHDLLPSRQAALEALRSGMRSGPVLLTGEAGAGKTWLADRLVQEADDLAWVAIDLAPDATPADLYADLGQALGLDPRVTNRRTLAEFLALRSTDGRRFGLLVDEGHLATNATLEELRVLSNRLGRLDGFATLLLAGQSELARRITTYALSALESRLAARVSLRPIDADEACFLLRYEFPGRLLDGLTIERLHRDAAGNPARLLRLAASAPSIPAERPPSPTRPGSRFRHDVVESDPDPDPDLDLDAEPDLDETETSLDAAMGDRLAAVRPPLRVEENFIEVGWDDAVSSPDVESEASDIPVAPVSASIPAESALPATFDREPVAVEDHYAALQAWQEWTHNQERRLSPDPSTAASAADSGPVVEPWSAALGLDSEDENAGDVAETDEDETASALDGMSNVWAEPSQEFAPFGPLFGRTRQANDRES